MQVQVKKVGIFFNGKVYSESGVKSARYQAALKSAEIYAPNPRISDRDEAYTHAQFHARQIELRKFGKLGLKEQFRFLADACIEKALKSAKDVRGGKNQPATVELSKKQVKDRRQAETARKNAIRAFKCL